MIDLMIIIYAAILWVVFKVFKVPLNKWTATTSILIGFFGIGFIVLVMNYFHPYSREARLYYYTTPIYSRIDGRVVEVPVERNVPLKKGDVLFRFDPRPFEYKVENLEAALEQGEVERDRSKEEYDRSLELLEKGAGSEREVQRWRIKYQTAIADIEAARAKLDRAMYDLEQEVVVRAPTDGYVTQVRVRPGMAIVASPQFIAALTFIHAEDQELVAAFPQNGLQNIEAGYEAEITFDAIPGRAFKGKVKQVLSTIAQGQLMPHPSGKLIDFDEIAMLGRQGRVPVKIEVLDDLSDFRIPAGGKAEVAVYSERWQAVSIVRRILLRMKSWQKFVFIGG
jgi:RND family efflux transporter MFP subunit